MSDFTDSLEISGGEFTSITESDSVDFIESGDYPNVTISGSGYGEGAYGEGPYGGNETVIVSTQDTTWTNIDEP